MASPRLHTTSLSGTVCRPSVGCDLHFQPLHHRQTDTQITLLIAKYWSKVLDENKYMADDGVSVGWRQTDQETGQRIHLPNERVSVYLRLRFARVRRKSDERVSCDSGRSVPSSLIESNGSCYLLRAQTLKPADAINWSVVAVLASFRLIRVDCCSCSHANDSREGYGPL